MTVQRLFTFLISGILLTVSATGCALKRMDIDPSLATKALEISNGAQSFNQHISTGKGTGWLRLETPHRISKFRVAWAAVSPNKIRMTLLMSGTPVETIISSGKKVTFISHTGAHDMHTSVSADPGMERYIKVPVKLSDIISILLGQLPVKPHDSAYFLPADPSLATIALKKKWGGVIQHLHLDDGGNVDSLVSMDSTGKHLYEMHIHKYKTYNSAQVPVELEITDPQKRKLTLLMTRFIVNPPVKESVFELTDPGS